MSSRGAAFPRKGAPRLPMNPHENQMQQTADIAGLKADVKNICRSLDEMKASAAEREKIIRNILEQTQTTHSRVQQLETHRKDVCEKHGRELEGLKAFRWKLMGAVGAVSYISGMLGQESMRTLAERIAGS